MVKRRKIPEPIQQLVLLEAGYKCANPVCRHVLTLDLHHIVWVRDGGGNHPDNLLALCPNCHTLHTKGHIPTQAILTWKSLLVSLGNSNRSSVDLLLVLADEDERIQNEGNTSPNVPKFRFTGDSLPAIAPLLTSQILEITQRYHGAGYFGGGHPSFEVALTERGRRIVSAWRAGNPDAIEIALDRAQ